MLYLEATKEIDGLTFNYKVINDDDHTAPWLWAEGCGPVRGQHGYTSKRPGEKVLKKGGRYEVSYLYDWQAAMLLARKDGWGVSDKPELWDTLTERQQLEYAVQLDFEYLQAWCNDEWVYSGMLVTLQEDPTFTAGVWGLEYWQYCGIQSHKNEYIYGEIKSACQDLARRYRKEQAEKLEWEQRGMLTIGT